MSVPGRDDGPATAHRRRDDHELVVEPIASHHAPAPDVGAAAGHGPRPRGRPSAPLRRALSRRRRRDPARPAGAAGPRGSSDGLAASGTLLAPPPRAAARGRLSRGWLAPASAPVGAASTTAGACGWPTTNERRCDRCGRSGFANRFRRTPDHPVRRTSAWRRLAKRTVEAHVAVHGWHCPGWHRDPHPVRPGELTADHPVPLVLGGEPLPARPGVLCPSCNARKGLSQRRR